MLSGPSYIEHMRTEGERAAEVATGNLDREVPSMPDWTLETLITHLAGLCNWQSTIVERLEAIAPGGLDIGPDPIARFRGELAHALEVFPTRDMDAPCWAWGVDQHARFWFRRITQELVVHRWDAENAVGSPAPLDAALAADGVDEFWAEFAPSNPFFKGAAEKFGGDGETMRLHATDVDQVWPVMMRPESAVFAPQADTSPDVAVAGTASDILLFLFGRVTPAALQVDGDGGLLERWQHLVKI